MRRKVWSRSIISFSLAIAYFAPLALQSITCFFRVCSARFTTLEKTSRAAQGNHHAEITETATSAEIINRLQSVEQVRVYGNCGTPRPILATRNW